MGGPKQIKGTSKLSPGQLEKARMVAASYVMEDKIDNAVYDGLDVETATAEALQMHGAEELKNQGLQDWTLNETLSTRDHLVLRKGNEF